MEMNDPILITGCARSGTSMTAGIISACGAYGGLTFGPNEWNKKGMFENKTIREGVIKPFLILNRADPKGQRPLPDIRHLLKISNLKERIEEIIKAAGYKDGPWYYKGAKMCLIWPTIQEAFPTAKWVIVRRKDEDIINSCMRTGFMNAYKDETGWQIWVDHHKTRFLEMLDAGLDVSQVWPEKMMKGDFEEIKKVIQHIGLEWNEASVKEFVSPNLWRNKDGQ